MSDPSPLMCIMGPTGSGKTDLSLMLAEHFPIEIISVDSAQIYRDMDIGSGKPDKSILNHIPHHLIDIIDPSETYSVWRFCQDALKIIEMIRSRHKVPLLVGGTMLYFRGLQQGLSDLPASTPMARETIQVQANEKGWGYLYERLKNIDPEMAGCLAPNDKQRISRALEVYEMTGQPFTAWKNTATRLSPVHTFMNIALIPQETSRSVLHDQIAKRFDHMLEQGLVEETQRLMDRGDLHENLPAMRAVGYRQVWQYLHHHYSFDEMREKAIAATRQLAKRQLTWIRQQTVDMTVDFAEAELFQRIQLLLNNMI